MVQHYLMSSIAPITRRSYSTAYRRYLHFCNLHHYPLFPVTEPILCYYVVFLAAEGLKAQSIKTYLSAVRYYQIMEGHGDPFFGQLWRLEYVIKGIKAEQARAATPARRTRLPVTPPILRSLRGIWEKDRHDADNIMLWAAVCTCFFGFLRSGEIYVPAVDRYDPGAHLSVGDVTLDDPHQPTLLQVTIKASKTDPFPQGRDLVPGEDW